MDKTAIKNYAVAARRKLIDAVRQKAYQLYIREEIALPPDEAKMALMNDGIFLAIEQMKSRERLVSEISCRVDELGNEKGYNSMMEEIAYTWFNRLIALRFMEVNDYLPSGIRVLSSVDEGRTEPDVIREADRLDYVDQAKITEYRDASPQKLYKYILIAQCNALSSILPGMFEKIDDYTELLLPDNLYLKGGIVHDLVHGIAEEDFRDQVEIIGWLYQYYISEKKDEVFAGLKKNIKINKETIPAATQLFTPEWIVRYMVENSLGRLWLERDRAESGLSNEYMNASFYGWKYYVEEAEQEPKVAEQLCVLRAQNPIKRPEDIKLIDPCMGSGHILVYAFDLLYQIYQSWGYAEREIPNFILQNNLYGLDIDKRAAQLAYFAMMMKARSYNRRFFRQDNIPDAHVYAMIESDGVQKHHLEYMGQGMDAAESLQCREDLSYLIDLFADAREYGSILKIDRTMDYAKLRRFVRDSRIEQLDIYNEGIDLTEQILLEILSIAEIMMQKYDVVVTNPPYMGSSGMNSKLSEYVKKEYPHTKSDLSTVFMEVTLDMCSSIGLMAMINIPVWMSLPTYDPMRERILAENTIVNMVHCGRGIFGSDFGTTTFVILKKRIINYIATYRRLFVDKGAVDTIEEKEKFFFTHKGIYTSQQEVFVEIPGMPIAYWESKKIVEIFKNQKLREIVFPKTGLTTGDNDTFLRNWFEISVEQLAKKWFYLNKGGEYRKWFGNNEYVVNWEKDGLSIKSFPGSTIRNEKFYFREGITWSKITAGKFSARYSPKGHIFDAVGLTCFTNEIVSNEYILAFLCSAVAEKFVMILNQTVSYTVGIIGNLPFIYINTKEPLIKELVQKCISIARSEWDSFETSWDFRVHPLVQSKMAGAAAWGDERLSNRMSSAFKTWELFIEGQFNKLKSTEEELNRIFIEIYGLQDELTPDVEDRYVTIRKADLLRDIRSFISYAVGCMFGRYSLNEPGLVFAGGEFDMARYNTFLPEEDNIIPIGANDYFDDDIVMRFIDFVCAVYGEDTLQENLEFIANALYPNGNGIPREKIRRYFLNDFFKDHARNYQKKPIYWLFDSGKQNGLKVLIYLHRYDKFTVARVRTDYLHPLQRKYESEIGRLEMLAGITENAGEKAAYRKEIEALQKKNEECRVYDQVVAHIAHQAIELDLDDGVTVNYAKFQGVEVPKDDGKIVKMDLLGKI